MTNLELDPAEVRCAATDSAQQSLQILTPREVPLGGIRAMTVRRTLPHRSRTLIGPWCFLDHYGPDDVAATGGMRVPPHPHTGLQTVSWLFSGEIEHRDSIGSVALVLPGEMNLMTAGRGIAHSEMSTPATTVLHGVQLWIALPAVRRAIRPAFEHYLPPTVSRDGVALQVFLGSLAGQTSPVGAHSPVLGAELRLPAGVDIDLDLRSDFEHGVLVDTGAVELDGTPVPAHSLACLPAGADRVRLLAAGGEPARVLLLGGEPLDEPFVMWWNFIGADHDFVAVARAQWQGSISGEPVGRGRFGEVSGYDGDPLPAPELPGGRLRPRG